MHGIVTMAVHLPGYKQTVVAQVKNKNRRNTKENHHD